MDCEICDLLSHMEDVQKTELMQFPFYIGRLCGQKVIVSKTFQGMVNAVLPLSLPFRTLCPAVSLIRASVADTIPHCTAET